MHHGPFSKIKLDPYKSPYAILGLAIDADEDEIKKAYRRQAMKLHPDHNPSPDAVDRFREVRQAYELLRSPISREVVKNIMAAHERNQRRWKQRGPERGPDGGQPGHKAVDWQQQFERYARERPEPGLSFLQGFSALVSYILHPTNVPLKALICFPLAYYSLATAAAGDGAELGLLALVLPSALLALTSATVIELLVGFASLFNRYVVRSIVNNAVVVLIAVSVLSWALSALLGGTILEESATLSLVQDLGWIGLETAVYSWLVFCFLFQKHHPTWEVALVWIGVLGNVYVLTQIMYPHI